MRYDQVRGIKSANASSCLKFFGELGLLEIIKAGTYLPTDGVVNFFSQDETKSASGEAAIRNLLTDSYIFDETVFIAENHDYTIERLTEELAEDIASDDEEDEDVQTAVQRFIEIFVDLDFFGVDDEDYIRLKTSTEEKTEVSNEESEPTQADLDSITTRDSDSSASRVGNNSDAREIDVSEPPARTSPEKLWEICEYMKDAGSVTVQEIEDDEDIDLSGDYVRHSIEYGDSLNFIQLVSSADDERYELTELGWELGYQPDLNEATSLFRSALTDSEEFSHIIRTLSEDTSVQKNGYVDRNTILRIYRAQFGLTDVGKDRLNRGVMTLFKTLDAAGYGQYVQGRGSNPTRVEIKSVDELISDFITSKPDSDTVSEEAVDIEEEFTETSQIDQSTQS